MKPRNTRIYIYLIVLILISLSFMTCNKKEEETDAPVNAVESQPDDEDASAPLLGDMKQSGRIRKDLTSLEAAKLMGNGINLGNTMEAYGRKVLGITAEVSKYETLWGQPVTTQEMIDKMKEAGFDTLRVPVAWTNTMDFENGDYKISDRYLDRVEEIINYGLNAGMYVIINDHWDGGWWGRMSCSGQRFLCRG